MRSDRQDELFREEERAQKIANTQRAEAAVVAVEMTDVSIIFGFKQYFAVAMEGLAHSILLPTVAGAALIRAILKIREAYLAKKEHRKGAVVRAAVETVAALAISTAVIGTFAAAASFALVGPIIFTVTLAAKTLFHLGSAIYYGIKAAMTQDTKLKADYSQKMKTNFVVAAVNALTTVAAGLVFIAHKASFGILGLIGGALGAVYAVYKGFTTKPAKQTLLASEVTASQSEDSLDEPPHSPSSKLAKVNAVNLNVSEVTLASSVPVQQPVPLANPLPTADFIPNTASIMQKTLTPISAATGLKKASPGHSAQSTSVVKEESLSSSHSEADNLSAVKDSLETKRELIWRKMKQLEKIVKSHRAFDGLAKHDENQRNSSINTYWWENLLEERFSKQTINVKAQMIEIDLEIKAYNNLIKANSLLLQEDSMRETLAASQAQILDLEKEEQRKKEFKERTGFSMDEALEIGHMAGLGAGSRYAF